MSAVQLHLLSPAPLHARWVREGCACEACDGGQMTMMHASDPCSCAETLCVCTAEGYARCDACGRLEQVWPRDMVAPWQAPDA